VIFKKSRKCLSGQKIINYMVMALWVIIFSGCITKKYKDSWYDPPTEKAKELQGHGWKKVINFWVVRIDKQDEAIEKLSSSPIIELTIDKFIYYGGQSDNDMGLKYYLIRSLACNSNIKGYNIIQKGGLVSVFHGSLGSKNVPAKRQAILIESLTPLDAIYVSYDHAR